MSLLETQPPQEDPTRLNPLTLPFPPVHSLYPTAPTTTAAQGRKKKDYFRINREREKKQNAMPA